MQSASGRLLESLGILFRSSAYAKRLVDTSALPLIAPTSTVYRYCIFIYRQDAAKLRQPVFKCTHRSKISIRPAGATRCTDSCEIWRSRGHVIPLDRTKFRCYWWERGPPNGQKFHFLVKSATGANLLTISTIIDCQELLYAELSCISISHLTGFVLQVTEVLLRNRASVIYHEFFRAPCRKNCVESKNDWHLFNGLNILYQHAKFGETDRTTRAGCRCENVVFVLCIFVTLGVGRAVRSSGI